MRVLQVLPTADPSPSTEAAVELHRALTAAGVEVRTLAAGAGRRPGPELDVPPMAPSPRSTAAWFQLRREAAWADVVVVRGRRARWLLRGFRRPAVWALDDPVRPTAPPRSGAAVVRTVVPSGAAAADGSVALPPVVLDPGPLPAAARAAARAQLGVPTGVLSAAVHGFAGGAGRRVVQVLSARGCHVVDADLLTDEVAAAASDVVVHPGDVLAGPSAGVLRLALAGVEPMTADGSRWTGGDLDASALAAAVDRVPARVAATGVAGGAREDVLAGAAAASNLAAWRDLLLGAADG